MSGLDFTAAVVDALAVFVTSLYQNVLDRDPEPAGLAAWTGFLRQNCTPNGFSTIAQAFFDSQEFRTSRPLTLTGLVTVLYRTFLVREPEPAGLTAWVEGFRQARLGLAQDFTLSAEFQSLLPDRTNRPAVTALVTRFYTEILGRAPEPAGLAGWVDYIVATRDLEGAAVSFLASEEFEGRALTFRDYVVILYRGVLGREPDPGGLDASGKRPSIWPVAGSQRGLHSVGRVSAANPTGVRKLIRARLGNACRVRSRGPVECPERVAAQRVPRVAPLAQSGAWPAHS